MVSTREYAHKFSVNDQLRVAEDTIRALREDNNKLVLELATLQAKHDLYRETHKGVDV